MDQHEAIEFLLAPSSHGVGPGEVRRIDTHAAVVFLAGENAYKIKRAVRYPYLDFSTLELRRVACLKELEINQRFAAPLYKGIVAITRRPDGGLEMNGAGEPVEFAVHMRRFAQPDLLLSRARNGLLDARLLKAVADVVAESHEKAPIAKATDAIAEFRRLVADLSDAFAREPTIFPAPEREKFKDAAGSFIDRSEHCLRLRGERGFIRRCHGDLHLENIVVGENGPFLFDAIDFDEGIATVDVLYDLAFLLMDLDRIGQRSAANLVMNRYLYRSASDLAIYGLIAMPLFLACRAGVRAMVSAARLNLVDGADRQGEIAQARHFFHLALDYLEPEEPLLVAVGGLSGSGKSTLAAQLASFVGPAPGALHLRSDLERKSIFGVEETERLAAKHYTPEISQKVYDYLARKASLGLRAGSAVIVDAVFSQQGERDAIEEVARAAGRRFVGLWLSADRETLLTRVQARVGDASDATASVVAGQIERGTGPVSWALIDATKRPQEVCNAARWRIELEN